MISPALLAQALPSATSGVDWLYQFTNNLTSLTTQNGGALTQLGLTELSCIALFTLIGMVINWNTATMTVWRFHAHPVRAGDRIYYRTGNPAEFGIADNSDAKVLSVDPHTNTLTIRTLDGSEVSYNPALTRKMTGQSTVYREEQRDLAVGERIRLTAADREQHIRSGDFAAVERIGEDNTLSVRLDNGKSAELDPEQAMHVEYGYVVEAVPQGSVDRVLISGEASELALHGQDLARLSPSTRDLAVYTSDNLDLNQGKEMASVEPGLWPHGAVAGIENIAEVSIPPITLEVPGIGLG